jgi:hypothetical protein
MDDKIKSLISGWEIVGNVLKLPTEQLDRKIYCEVKKQLEFCGGKWVSGKKGFVFPQDPTAILQASISSGGVKKEDQFFPTPAEIADKMTAEIIGNPVRILEPSAGRGALLHAFYRKFPELPNLGHRIDCIELNPVNRQFLENHPQANVLGSDFLKHTGGGVYDLILANPPFSKNADVIHIRKMWDCLADGGQLITLASPHWEHSSNRTEREFRAWLDDIGAEVTEIEAGAFAASGTTIATRMITARKY